jgi:hypothetical protein
MSLNKNLYKYSLRCSSENKLVYCWNEESPQVCPNNTNHLIDLNSITIIDSVIQNSVNVIQSSGTTSDNYRVESKKIIIPPNTVLKTNYTWSYPISVMTINWTTNDTHIGDIVNGYLAPNTTIGAITSNVVQGDTLIHVSDTVLLYSKIGYMINITNGLNNIIMGEVLSIDTINKTLLLNTAASSNINAPAYVQLTVHNIYNIHLQPGITNLASKHIKSSSLPANTIAQLEYNNTSNVEKTFIFWFEFLY